MARKIFYIVRHGESILNAQHIRQGVDGDLSELGKSQAEKTGKRIRKIKFDAILCSPYTRTMQTADIIVSQLKKKRPVEYLHLLIERRNPSQIIGKNADSEEVKKIVDVIDRSAHDDDFRYSDEENFNDLKERVKDLLHYLEKRPEKRFLLVTHSIFLKILGAYLIRGDALDSKTYNLLSFLNQSTNASITICEYNSGWLGDGIIGRFFFPLAKRWRLLAWDDYTVEQAVS
jgi:broad specificity phosphatase PhoE